MSISNNNNSIDNNQNDPEAQQHHKAAAIRVSVLPHHVQKSAKKLDIDRDGELGAEDLASVLSDLDKNKKANGLLRRALAVFGVVSVLLIGGVFASSIAAARLSQDIAVDPTNGFAYASRGGAHEVLKTAEALDYVDGSGIGKMSNEELHALQELILDQGNLSFSVRGHARDPTTGNIVLQVEGGTLTLDEDGIIDARGDAKILLETVFGALLEHDVEDDGNRHYTSWDVTASDEVGAGWNVPNDEFGTRRLAKKTTTTGGNSAKTALQKLAAGSILVVKRK